MAAAIAYEQTEEREVTPRDDAQDALGSPNAISLGPSHSGLEPRVPESPGATAAEILAASPQNQEEEDVVEDEAETEIHAGTLSAADEPLKPVSATSCHYGA